MKKNNNPKKLMQLKVNKKQFIAILNNKEVATMPFDTLKPEKAKGASVEDFETAEYYLEDYVPGEVFKHPFPEIGNIILGPKRDFTHVVTLRAYGNPDYSQYADIGPKKQVMVCSIEEAKAAFLRYRDQYDLGGGNCGEETGVVYKLPAKTGGRRTKLGRFSYNGRFWTNKEWEETMSARP